ncbi:uncharacterized protein LY89DRAFT_657169 [Mollisia scopiformis]|uniref:Telomere-associated protein Rif1 N-terminal domain-containing protein n=1 Tax=Mollisia scopiformis TaxID=149040 RepID=A0A132BBB1_MOLSC|nr:uncharacterized protein LY89DRAFT_657169 [Mollisia scopiformis]KUJ09710.1 hypothetical protein LY89DRAFT_657169 [Mollisia scopiformis]
MVESPPGSKLPPTLQARPPTPPRESNQSNTKSSFVGRLFRSSSTRRSSAPVSSTYTPDSSAESPTASGSSRKRVGFSDWPQYKDPPTVSFDGKGVLKHPVQPLPPSAERKPSKSILKAHNGNQEQDSLNIEGGNTALLPLHHYATFSKMLESIVQQLAGKDRSSKVDAYLMLCGSLKASDNVPDPKALKDQMGLLCQFIERDLSQKLDNGKPDSSLMVHGLTLLGCFLHKPSIAESLPVDFTLRFVDHAIRVLDDGSMSKEVTKHLMFMLAQQNFSTKVMNQDRVGKLIAALHTIEDRIKGKSIVHSRLQIYRTLLRQSRNHMLVHTVWIEDLLSDMLSSLKDIRATAIAFGLEAGFSLGIEHSASRAMQSILRGEWAEGLKFIDYYIERLKTSSKNREESSTVPQVWSVVILFFRSKPQCLEQWQFFSQFLGVLQACFNIADNPTRTEAHYAWNRLIFAVRPNEKTSPKLRAMLFQALSAQLKRKSSSGRKRTLSSIYTLLYYTLNPTSTHAELDMYWDELLVPLVNDCLTTSKKEIAASEMAKVDAVEACLILQCLFDSRTPRKWSETRAMDNLMQNGMDAKELPALDSKWLRKNHTRIFELLQPLLQKLYWDLGEDSAITRLWKSYVTSIASAAIMEVKVSFDMMSCIASIFGTIHKFWGVGPEALGSLSATVPSSKHVAFWKGLETILTISIEGLGILPFTDKTLSIKHDNFIAVATPSQQPKKIRLETKSPLYHLISLLSNTSSVLVFDHGFSQMIHNILVPFFEKKSSKQARVEFVKDLVVLLPTEATLSVKSLWQALADFAVIAIDTRERAEPAISSEIPLGTNYRYVVSVLETGILFSPQRPMPRWKILLEAVIVSATLDAGESGKAIAVLEPLAKTLKSRATTSESGIFGLTYLSILLGKATYPKDRQALDAAERTLWGSKQSSSKTTSFDPYSELYTYTLSCLESSYPTFVKSQFPDYADLVSGITGLLGRCPVNLLEAVLANLQSGIALWIVDLESKLTGGNALASAIISLWATVCKSIATLCQSRTHTKILKDFEVLICAGLQSKHKTVVNSTIVMWNATFGLCKNGLEYPQNAKEALLKLHSIVELQLPFFPESLETDAASTGHRQPASLIGQLGESSQYSGFSSMDSAINGYLAPPGPKVMQKIRQSTPQVIINTRRSESLKRSREETPEAGRKNSKRRDVTPKLRHDDSQVQFAAIPSSSPGFDRVVDSQLLTEKQKEVRERQQAEAAMFPDLRSSPRPRGRLPESEDVEPDLPIHRSSSKIRDMISRGTERETTPTVVIPSDDDNGYVASSPTPTPSLRARVEDPPSSPPEAAAKRRDPARDEQISSSPPEGTPEPINAASPAFHALADTAVVLDDQRLEEPQSDHNGTFEPGNEDILLEITEANIDDDDSVSSPRAAFTTGEDIPDIALIDHTDMNVDENDISQREEAKLLDAGNDTTLSIDPSAQIDPDAMEIKYIISTNDISINERSSSPTEDPSEQLRASQLEHEAILASAEAQTSQHQLSNDKHSSESVPSSIAELEIEPVYEPETPGTPVRHGLASEPHSPKTPLFVDALTSPAGSDKHDVFEDAVSSPRLTKAPKMQDSSSPLSDMDESSLLRVVAGYDQSSDKHVSFLDDKENQPRQTRSSLSKGTQGISSPAASASAPSRKSAMRKKSGAQQSSQADEEVLRSEVDQFQTSSLPSLIPETPAPNTGNLLEPDAQSTLVYRDDDGEVINMDETIIVDTSILELEGGLRTHKRSPRKKGRKRKHIEEHTSTSELPDIQGGDIEDDVHSQSLINTSTPPPPSVQASSFVRAVTPTKKKRKGRPSRASQARVEAESSQEIGASQSFTSADGDISMADTEISMMAETSVLEQPEIKQVLPIPSETEEIQAIVEDGPEKISGIDQIEMEDDIVMDTILLDDPSSSDMDVVAETTFEDSSSAVQQSSMQQPEVHTHKENVVEQVEIVSAENEAPTSNGYIANDSSFSPAAAAAVGEISEDLESSLPKYAGVDNSIGVETTGAKIDSVPVHDAERESAQEDSKVEEKPAVTMQSMKEKLQGLITDLRSAALNRQEIHELEDMFMDAKRVLYDVELRGRQSADM